jgi:UDP-N-acetylglucosamine transferase subunit ALG13
MAWPVTLVGVSANSIIDNTGKSLNWDQQKTQSYKDNAQTIIDVGSLLYSLAKVTQAVSNVNEQKYIESVDKFFEDLSKNPNQFEVLKRFEALEGTSKSISSTLQVLMKDSRTENLEAVSDVISTAGGNLVKMYNSWKQKNEGKSK